MANASLPTKERLRLVFEEAKELASRACRSEIPIKRYVRTSSEMLRMSNIHITENNYHYAYFLSVKAVFLLQKELKLHPQYSLLDASDIQLIQKNLKSCLKLAESCKGNAMKIFDHQHEKYRVKQAEAERQRIATLEKTRPSESKISKPFTNGKTDVFKICVTLNAWFRYKI